MRLCYVAAALLASLGCGETRSDVARSGAGDPTFSDAGDSGHLVFGSGGGPATGHGDAAGPMCLRATLVREPSEAGTSCTFRLPDPSTFKVSSYDPKTMLTMSYVDTAGPRYELPLPRVLTASDCAQVSSAYYFTPFLTPEYVVLCSAACAFHYEAEAGTVGGALVATYGCNFGGDPVR